MCWLPNSLSLYKSPGKTIKVLNQSLTGMVKCLSVNKFELDTEKMEVMLFGKAELLKAVVISSFGVVQFIIS